MAYPFCVLRKLFLLWSSKDILLYFSLEVLNFFLHYFSLRKLIHWLAHPFHIDLQCHLWQVSIFIWEYKASIYFSGFTILSHRSVFLSLCPYHTILITLALYEALIPARAKSIHFKVVLAFLTLPHIFLESICQVQWKTFWRVWLKLNWV